MKINKKTGGVAIETVGDALSIITNLRNQLPKEVVESPTKIFIMKKKLWKLLKKNGTNNQAIGSYFKQEQI